MFLVDICRAILAVVRLASIAAFTIFFGKVARAITMCGTLANDTENSLRIFSILFKDTVLLAKIRLFSHTGVGPNLSRWQSARRTI